MFAYHVEMNLITKNKRICAYQVKYMLRNRSTWRKRMNDVLKTRKISIESILNINEMLYDEEVKELVQWLLSKDNFEIDEEEIYKQINKIRSGIN